VGDNFHFVNGKNWTLGNMHTKRSAKQTYWTAELFSLKFPHQLSARDLTTHPELRELLFSSSLICNKKITFNAILPNSPHEAFTPLNVLNGFDITTVKTAIAYENVKQRNGKDAKVRSS